MDEMGLGGWREMDGIYLHDFIVTRREMDGIYLHDFIVTRREMDGIYLHDFIVTRRLLGVKSMPLRGFGRISNFDGRCTDLWVHGEMVSE